MSVYNYRFPSSTTADPPDPLDIGLVYFDQLAIELNTAWSGAISFTLTGQAANVVQPHALIAAAGLLSINTVETPDAGQVAAMEAAIEAHTADPSFAFTVADPPLNPELGELAYLSDCARPGGGAGCPCYFDGTDWRRCSDDAVATT